MKRNLMFGLLTGLLCLAGSGPVLAEEHEDTMKVVPVELWTCTYNEGKGPSDLDAATAKWNAWADEQGMDNYTAWTLTPYYYGPEQEFDVIWLGAGKDAVSLGKAQDAYLHEDAGIRAGFMEVVTCDAHANFASLQYKAPPENATPKGGVLTFSDCKLKKGAAPDALNEAMNSWTAHLEEGGSTAGVWHWYPAYGGGGEGFDFKWIEGFADFAALGADYEAYGNGGGYKVARELFGDMLDCDSNRAYLVENRRYVQLR